MKIVGTYLTGCALIVLSGALLVLPQFAASHGGQSTDQSANSEPIPAFHAQAPGGALPPTMDPAIYSDKVVSNAYTVAGRVKKVLYQEPCYCHCDKGHGHSSLLDCFTSKHGSMCNVCMAEAIYSYEQTQKKKTPAEIRQAIIAGEWQHIDGSKYTTYPAKP